ncbi:MAG: cache domain-containing protein [Methanoregulaceae archaeon]|nr:cache domain-containing protein [Methanoregulaceae archaeon]MCU0629494.1 cache domain-containing protein [Methanoregulaceae archaeon]
MTTQPPTTTSTVTATLAPAANLSADEQRVLALVTEAVAYAREHGREKALAEFNNPNGSFIRGDMYIFSVDYNGTCLATPALPEWVGTDRLNEVDVNGTLFIQKEIELAHHGGGFITVHFPNPVHGLAIEPKLCYVKDVDGTYWIGSGIYNPGNVTVSR